MDTGGSDVADQWIHRNGMSFILSIESRLCYLIRVFERDFWKFSGKPESADMKFWKAMVAGAMTLSFAGVSAAQDLPVPDGGAFDRVVGAAVVVLPDYEGSDDYTFAPAPILQYKFSGERYVQIVGNKAFINVLNHPNFELGPKFVYRFGRDDVDDSAVDRMRDVDDSFEVGGFVGFKETFDNNIRHRMNIHFDVTQDVSNGHDGLVAELAGIYWRPVAKDVVRLAAPFIVSEPVSPLMFRTLAAIRPIGLPVAAVTMTGTKRPGIFPPPVATWREPNRRCPPGVIK